jgi:hypothetical protein
MPETSTNHGFNERLSALRPSPMSPDPRSDRGQGSRVRIELLLGVVLVGCGLIAAVFLSGGKPAPLAPIDTTAVVAAPPVPAAGEMLVAVAVKEGRFPPSLAPGDVVRVIVTPSLDGFGDLRALTERTVVHSISSPSDLGTEWVVTLVGTESVLAAVAGSGPVHLGIVGAR